MAQLSDLLGLSASSSANVVLAWLRDAGVEAQQTLIGDFVRAPRVPVSVASRLLDATFSLYSTTSHGGASLLRAPRYSVPSSVAAHLELVGGVSSFRHYPRRLTHHALRPTDLYMNPKSIHNHYQFPLGKLVGV